MNRVNNILLNEKYKEYIEKNKAYEIERVFCHHDMQHFIDTARIAYIMSLEKGFKIEKTIIYAAALLHDIGRWKEYKEGTPHEVVGVELAKDILIESGYSGEEIAEILQAISNHRKKDNISGSLSDLLSKSDKLSRNCFDCLAEKQCNWSKEKKNFNIQF